MTAHSAKKGFTLVEILVALAVFSIIILTLFSSFSGFMSVSEQIREAIDQGERADIFAGRMGPDLDMLYITRPPRFRPPEFGDDPDIFRFAVTRENLGGKSFSRIGFASLGAVKTDDTPKGKVVRLVYHVKEGEDGKFNLYRSQQSVMDPGEPDACTDPLIARDISRFDVFCRDREGDRIEEWDSQSRENEFRLPEHIVVKLGFISGDDEAQEMEAAFRIRVNREVK